MTGWWGGAPGGGGARGEGQRPPFHEGALQGGPPARPGGAAVGLVVGDEGVHEVADGRRHPVIKKNDGTPPP